MSAAGTLSGQLGLVSLFDLGQLLMLNRATGCLAVLCEEKKGYLYFRDGRIINAVDDTYHEGERAAHRVFSWRTGTFEFRPEPVDDSATIEVGTDGLMLEAARRLDEAHQELGGQSATGEASRVLEHRASVEALRDAFQQVAGAVGLLGVATGSRATTPDLEALALPGDRLVYRPGHPPRLRQRRAWHEAREMPLDDSEYEDLRVRLLRSCVPVSPRAAGISTPRRIALGNGRAIALEIVNEGRNEAIWLRPVDLEAPAWDALEGDLEALEDLLDSAEGLILVGAPTLETARRLLHAIIDSLADRSSATLLVISDDETYRQREGPGVILRSSPADARSTLRAIQPEIVAIDPEAAGGDLTLDDFGGVPCVVAGVVGSEAPGLLPRWLARVAALGRVHATLATVPIAVVVVEQEADDESPLSLSVWRLPESQRPRALAGETPVLEHRNGEPAQDLPHSA